MAAFPILDVAISLGFLYLLFALACTTLNEIIASTFDRRAKMLRQGIEHLLGDKNLTDELYRHPGIVSLAKSGLAGGARPSYIPGDRFATVLTDHLTGAQSLTNPEAIAAAIQKLPRATCVQLQALFDLSKGDPEEFRRRIAAWYDETMDRVSGWYKRRAQYSLLAIATGLGDALPNNASDTAAPYRSVVVNDLVLDAEGRKMSKSRGNVVDPWAVFSRHGVDAVRLFLVSSTKVWEPRSFDENLIRQGAGRFLLTLKNIYSGMFAQYANFGWAPSSADPAPADRPLLDRWILSRLATVERAADEALMDYDATAAVRTILEFVDDDVANWYVRQSRKRFYDVDTLDNRAAFATLHEVLTVVCRLLAPFAPFVTDWLHRELTGESVHLASYVRTSGASSDAALESTMASVRTLATLGRAAREQAGINVRQPLARMVCVAPNASAASLAPLLPVLASELNVKKVEVATSADALVTLEAKPNFRALGKKFGKRTPLAADAVSQFTSEHLRRFEQGEELVVTVDGDSHEITADDLTIVRRASGALVVQEEHGYFAAIDPAVTSELRQEGMARELISRVQRMRRDAGLAVSDRIRLGIDGDAAVLEAATIHREWIAGEVLATDVVLGGEPEGNILARLRVDLDGVRATLALTKDE